MCDGFDRTEAAQGMIPSEVLSRGEAVVCIALNKREMRWIYPRLGEVLEKSYWNVCFRRSGKVLMLRVKSI
jgi:hypothetical protein